jgi:hypothetical protein
VASRLTVASSWRIRSSNMASRTVARGRSSGWGAEGSGVGGEESSVERERASCEGT